MKLAKSAWPVGIAMTGEFYIEGQGDAALHEAILEAGDRAAAEAVSWRC